MKITDLLTISTIDLNASANNKNEIIEKAVALINNSGAINDLEAYKAGIYKREEQSTTGVGEEIAIPHCKSNVVNKPALAAMVIKEGVDFASLDGKKVKLLFLIAAPDNEDNTHLDVLARLSNMLMYPEFKDQLLKAQSNEEFIDIINKTEDEWVNQKAQEFDNKYPDIVAASSCPTGIAHTYMAQEALEKIAKELGYTIKVETNGCGGTKNKLTQDEINNAKAIIVAADAYIEMSRFDGKKIVQCGTSKAIKKPAEVIKDALDEHCATFHFSGAKKKADDGGVKKGKLNAFYRHLMSGISHMVPLIVAGGILLAIAYIIDACAGIPKDATDAAGNLIFGNATIGAKIFHMLGAEFGLGLMLPVLAGFIAYSMAGKPGLVAGFIGGISAKFGQFSLLYFLTGINVQFTTVDGTVGNIISPFYDKDMSNMLQNSAAGFLGAIIAGFLAGFLVITFQKLLRNTPKTIEGLKDMLIIPLLSALAAGICMLIINIPLSYLNIGINMGLTALAEKGLVILLAILASALMATDMGGPLNKATHYAILGILTSSLASGENLEIAEKLMCANIVGIMTPPIGIALAIWLFPQKFSKEDRTAAVSNTLTGCCGITEGAIPYLTKDPIRVLISTIGGAAVGGAFSFLFGGIAIAPEGGMISMVTMGAEAWKGILATLIGSAATGFLLGFLKKDVKKEDAQLGKWKGIPTQPVYNVVAKVGNFFAKPFKKNKENK